VSSDHHIIGIQGKDMPAAMRPTQDHHGKGGKDSRTEKACKPDARRDSADRSGNQLKKSGSPFVVGGSPFDQAVGPLYAKNERTPGPVDHDLHAGRRLRHDRLGAYGHSANESVPLAGGGRHKITSVR
jgi:hypothetical protein